MARLPLDQITPKGNHFHLRLSVAAFREVGAEGILPSEAAGPQGLPMMIEISSGATALPPKDGAEIFLETAVNQRGEMNGGLNDAMMTADRRIGRTEIGSGKWIVDDEIHLRGWNLGCQTSPWAARTHHTRHLKRHLSIQQDSHLSKVLAVILW